MRITCKDSSIDINDNELTYNGNTINISCVDLFSLAKQVISFLSLDEQCQVFIDKRPLHYTLGDSFMLLVVGIKRLYVSSLYDAKDYEITFSYNFPLVREPQLFGLLLDNLKMFSDAQLITLGERGDFLVADVSNDAQFQLFWKRRKQFIRRNDNLFDHKKAEYPLLPILNNWHQYCIDKFNVDYPQNRIDAYDIIYSTPGFLTDVFLVEDSIVSQGVIFVSNYSKTVYYCIFSWDNIYAKYSPGVYAYCKAIQWCHENGYCFSFCYGKQDYKFDLVKEFSALER